MYTTNPDLPYPVRLMGEFILHGSIYSRCSHLRAVGYIKGCIVVVFRNKLIKSPSIKAFLTDRTYVVVLDHSNYINDVPEKITFTERLFAGDTKILQVLKPKSDHTCILKSVNLKVTPITRKKSLQTNYIHQNKSIAQEIWNRSIYTRCYRNLELPRNGAHLSH